MSVEADEAKVWKWEITPNPYDGRFDSVVTDDDEDARAAILYAAEMHLFDDNDAGETRTLTVVHNATKDAARG